MERFVKGANCLNQANTEVTVVLYHPYRILLPSGWVFCFELLQKEDFTHTIKSSHRITECIVAVILMHKINSYVAIWSCVTLVRVRVFVHTVCRYKCLFGFFIVLQELIVVISIAVKPLLVLNEILIETKWVTLIYEVIM